MAEKSSKGKGQPIPKIEINLKLSPEQGEELLKTLQVRFEKNMQRHIGLDWPKIQAKLKALPEKLASLHAMETTDGEPDVIGYDQKTGEYIFLIVQRKARMAAEVSVTIGKGRKEEKRKVFTQRVTLLISPPRWGSSF